MTEDYIQMLERVKDFLKKDVKIASNRLVVPPPDIFWVGHRTVIKNFKQIADILGRDPQKTLINIAKQLGAPASMDRDGQAIILGKKDNQSIKNTIQYYIKNYVVCPVCGSMDTKITKERRIAFIVCDACGSKSPVKQ